MVPPCPEPFNLTSYVLEHACADPDKVALSVCDLETRVDWTYGALRAAVYGTATGLKSAGLVAGDVVLLRLGNSADFPIAFLGAIAMGAIPVPTSAQLTTPEVSKIAAIAAPRAVLHDGTTALPKELPNTVIDLQRLRSFYQLSADTPNLGDANRPAYIVFTSGTSGQPSGVVHAHRAIWTRRMMWDDWYGLRPDDTMMHAGAFNWTYTLGTGLLDPWACGATAMVPASSVAITDLPELLSQYDPTIFAASPGVFRRILRHNITAGPRLRHALSAGEKLSDDLRRRWHATTRTHIHEAFGMTECSTFISGGPLRPAPENTLGFAQKGRRISVLDETDNVGEIAIHRDDPGLMLGYLNDDAKTASRFAVDWFKTGDMAEILPDGAFRYVGRADDVLTAGGYRISPVEVEQALTLHPAVDDCAVVQVIAGPNTTLIAAFCTGQNIPDADMAAHCTARLAKYKQPHIYVWLDTLPRGANNKLLRRHLRQDWETTHGQT